MRGTDRTTWRTLRHYAKEMVGRSGLRTSALDRRTSDLGLGTQLTHLGSDHLFLYSYAVFSSHRREVGNRRSEVGSRTPDAVLLRNSHPPKKIAGRFAENRDLALPRRPGP